METSHQAYSTESTNRDCLTKNIEPNYTQKVNDSTTETKLNSSICVDVASSKNNSKRIRPFENYQRRHSKRSGRIEFGACGFFVTADGAMREKPAVREFYNLFDSCYVHDSTTDNVLTNESIDTAELVNLDAADELTKACNEAVFQHCDQSDDHYSRKFLRQVPTNVKNCLFFQCTLPADTVYAIADAIVKKCQANNCCRFVARCTPVEVCTSIELNHFSIDMERMLHRHFMENNINEKPPTYALQFKARNCDALSRNDVLMIVDEQITALSPKSRVNLSSPELTILVNILHKNVLLSCIREYHAKRKFSTRPPTEAQPIE